MSAPLMATAAGAEGLALDMESTFEGACIQADRVADQEIQNSHTAVDHKGFEGGVGDHGARFGELDKANHRGQGRALDHLDQKPDGGGNRYASGLGQDDVAHGLRTGKAKRAGGCALAFMNAFNAGAKYFGNVCAVGHAKCNGTPNEG